MRRICSSRGVSVASTLRVCSPRLPWIAASTGEGASSSSTKSPSELSSSSPIGVSSEIGSLTILSVRWTLSSGISICSAISSGRGSRPSRWTSRRVTRSSLLTVSTMWTGDADGAALVGDRARHRLPDPPRRVGRKLEAALILELVARAHQSDVSFLDKVEETQAAVGVALGQAHDQAQVGFGQLLLGAPALMLSAAH